MKRMRILACALMIAVISAGCVGSRGEVIYEYEPNTNGTWDIAASPINGAALQEDKSIYEADSNSEIVELYLTVRPGKNSELKSEYTFDALNNYTGGGDEPYCEVIFQEGANSDGPQPGYFSYGENVVNGRLELKGNVSSLRQRSYQVKLYSRAGLWRGVQTVNLYKELPDLSRMKNKLGFDAVETLTSVIGFRTVYVHLFIWDRTGSGELNGYQDMGLYLFMEQPNKAYLNARGFDTQGNLYKASNFDFSRYPDELKLEEDRNYDKDSFESVLTIREGSDHTKLLNMLDAVNDETQDIGALVQQYFNEENLLHFAALNILFGNYRLMYDNYLIYSPQNSNSWYFIPADFGNALEKGTGISDNSLPDDFVGLGMLYDNVLFRRYFSQKENIIKLAETVEEMHKTINADFVAAQTEQYRTAVLPRLYSMPDLSSLPRAAEHVEPYIAELPSILEEYYSLFFRNLNQPLPPYITQCEAGERTLALQWLPSNAGVTYTVEAAYDATFLNLVYQKIGYADTSITLPRPADGIYYIRVTAVDQYGNSQRNANIYTNPFGDKIYGVYELELR